jgi:hypothetical protein
MRKLRQTPRGSRSIHSREQRGGGLHFGESKGSTFKRYLIATPQFHVPIFVDMSRTPRLIDVEPPMQDGERQKG